MINLFYFKSLRFSNFILLCSLISICSYTLPIHANKPNVINFYRETYQADNKNWAIANDSSGIMYFGNDKGLLEFDGIRWQLYTLPKAEIVRAVAVSSNNLIFTGGYEEFGMWKRDISGALIYTSLSKDLKKGLELHNDEIWKILISDDVIYFQSFNHIYTYDYHQVKVIDTSGSGILFLMHVYNDFFIQKIAGNLCKLNNGQLEDIPSSAFLKNTEIRLILPYPGKRYLVGTSTSGLYIFDGKEFTPWDSEFSQLIKPYQLNNGIMLKDGRYFFGTILNGLYEVSPEGKIINHFSTNNLLQNNTVLSLYEDFNNNVWVALDRGISYIQYLRDMDCYTDHSGKAGAVYSAAFFNDKLFLGTNQGVYYLPKNQMASSQALSYLKIVDGTEGQIWDLKVVDNRLLCGHNNGLIAIDKNMHLSYFSIPGVYNIKPDDYFGRNILFLASYNSAFISSPDLKKQNTITEIQEPIRRIETDHLGNIWLEHAEKGLYRCRFSGSADSIKYYKLYGGSLNDGLPHNLFLFKLGNRVVFYGNDTFYVYDDLIDKIVEYKELNNCFKGIKSVKNLIPLSKNLYLVIGNNCVYKVFHDGYEIKILDRYDIGYSNLSLVNKYENAVALNDSLALICLDNGFLLYHVNEKTTNTFHPQAPHLRSITIFDSKNKRQQIAVDDIRPAISYTSNTILFDFFSRDVLSQNLYFQYQLEGVNTDWSEPSKINEISFERLPSGDYTFLLRTVDNLGNHSEPLSFSFTVKPPWYATAWAVVGYIFLFVLTMMLIWLMILRRYRNTHLLKIRMRETQRLRKQNMNLQREVEEKNAELFSQTSFIIQKNELILKVKNEIDTFYNNFSGNKILRPLYEKVSVLLNKNMNIDEDWKMFLIQFEQQHTGFFKRMKEIQPDLTSHELKLCACLKLNLSSKDIASLLNISIRGVENGRYRLRKKLNITPNQNLNDYFLQF